MPNMQSKLLDLLHILQLQTYMVSGCIRKTELINSCTTTKTNAKKHAVLLKDFDMKCVIYIHKSEIMFPTSYKIQFECN